MRLKAELKIGEIIKSNFDAGPEAPELEGWLVEKKSKDIPIFFWSQQSISGFCAPAATDKATRIQSRPQSCAYTRKSDLVIWSE